MSLTYVSIEGVIPQLHVKENALADQARMMDDLINSEQRNFKISTLLAKDDGGKYLVLTSLLRQVDLIQKLMGENAETIHKLTIEDVDEIIADEKKVSKLNFKQIAMGFGSFEKLVKHYNAVDNMSSPLSSLTTVIVASPHKDLDTVLEFANHDGVCGHHTLPSESASGLAAVASATITKKSCSTMSPTHGGHTHGHPHGHAHGHAHGLVQAHHKDQKDPHSGRIHLPPTNTNTAAVTAAVTGVVAGASTTPPSSTSPQQQHTLKGKSTTASRLSVLLNVDNLKIDTTLKAPASTAAEPTNAFASSTSLPVLKKCAADPCSSPGALPVICSPNTNTNNRSLDDSKGKPKPLLVLKSESVSLPAVVLMSTAGAGAGADTDGGGGGGGGVSSSIDAANLPVAAASSGDNGSCDGCGGGHTSPKSPSTGTPTSTNTATTSTTPPPILVPIAATATTAHVQQYVPQHHHHARVTVYDVVDNVEPLTMWCKWHEEKAERLKTVSMSKIASDAEAIKHPGVVASPHAAHAHAHTHTHTHAHTHPHSLAHGHPSAAHVRHQVHVTM